MKKIILLILLGAALISGYLVYQEHADRMAGDEKHARDKRITEENERRLVMAKRKAGWKKLKSDIEKELGAYRVEVGLVVKDLEMNWEINCNKDGRIPAASIIKIPVMLAYELAAKEKKVDLSSKVELKASDMTPGSGILKTFKPGSEFSIDEIIYLMITQSDNTATNILINMMGMAALNNDFKRIGLKQTALSRKMMDFSRRKEGVENYTSANDMAYCLEKLYRNKFISPAVSKKCLRFLASQKVNDRIPKKLPQGVVVAHKTGLENNICHDVGIVYTNKGNFLICFLTKHPYKHARLTKKLIQDVSLMAYSYYDSF